MMATTDEIAQLKQGWQGDPCWDIENTEGFEEHRADLLQYRLDCEAKWEADYQEELRVYATRIGLDNNLKLAEYIRQLETKVDQLSEKLDRLNR